MEQQFSLRLTAEEKDYLLSLAKLAIVSQLNGKFAENNLPEPPTEKMRESYGAFVTLKKNSHLRGCIGYLTGGGPLYLTVARMAISAAFRDPRFPPLKINELENLAYEVSVLSPITSCKNSEQVIIGRHGLIMKGGGRQGLLLPQVPVEWKWDRLQFLEQTCVKAGLPRTTWQKAWKEPGIELYWFEAEVF